MFLLYKNYTQGFIYPATLVAGAIIGFFAITSLYLLPLATTPTASMAIEPESLQVAPGDTFSVTIFVTTTSAVNAFAGTLTFNTKTVSVHSIDYNTSIADLWAEAPWYKAGAGTISFAGGSTKPGGFSGRGGLLTITFAALAPGTVDLHLADIQILQHDGLGTETALREPIDGIFTVARTPTPVQTIPAHSSIAILPKDITTDLNNDGVTTFSDVSIFMLYLATGDLRGDFDGTGTINTDDLNLILRTRQ